MDIIVDKNFKFPKFEKIIDFPMKFLKVLTKKTRDNHVSIIEGSHRSTSGASFKKLSKDYAILKKVKYGHDKPNLKASGLLLEHLEPNKPEKSSRRVRISYGIRSGKQHPRNSGSLPSAKLMTYHQEGTETMPARDISGEKALHNDTRDKVVDDLVNQVAKNIEKALKPYKADLTI